MKIGLMPPLSGLVEMYGQEITWAAEIAVQQINAAGGLLGVPLDLVIEDDGSLPQTAVPAALRLVQDHGCHAIIGNLLSNSRIDVAAKVANPLKVPYLNFSFYEGSIFSRYFFHFAALPNQQIEKMIPFMAGRYGKKVFFAGNNYEWPRGSISAGMRSLATLGGEVVGEEYLSIGVSKDELIGLLERVARSGADVFVPYFAGHDQIALLTAFAEMGLKDHMAVVMGHYDEVIARTLSPQVRDGLYSVNTYFMSVDTPDSRAYLAALQDRWDVDGLHPRGNGVLTNFGEGTYICVKAFAEAVRACGSVDAEAVVEALQHVEIDAPQGKVLMEPRLNHAHVNTYLTRCRADGTFEIIDRFGLLAPKIPERYRTLFGQGWMAPAVPPADIATRSVEDTALEQRTLGSLRKILSLTDLAIIATNTDGVITDCNAAANAMFGYEGDELEGTSVHLLVPPHLRQHHEHLFRRFLQDDADERLMRQCRGDITGYRKDGTFFPLEASIAKFLDGNHWVLVATMRDLTATKQAEEDLTRRATHDPLTGLPNRALIQSRVENALLRSRRQSESVAVLFVDLDGFKEINDTHGHSAGDQVLTTTAQRLIETVRPGDTVSRIAGDEFVVLCEHVNTPIAISAVADRILSALRRPFPIDGTSVYVTASIGIAVGHGATHTMEDIFRAADTAMYAVKAKGRDGWQFFNESLQAEASQRLAISTGLRTAVERDELRVLFQPIVQAETGFVIGAEVLLRWHPAIGDVSPSAFIPVAEMTGSIVPIGRWVFEQACRAERTWRDRFGDAAPFVSVNVSARQLSDAGLVADFTAIMDRTGADPTRLQIEVTETSLMADVQANRDMIKRLSGLGIAIAVDDFGTGYSSLAQLMRLNADTLKIDKVFVQSVDQTQESRVIVSALCRIAKSLRLKLVAEGVETASQRNQMRLLGCDQIQGYFFHRPMPEADFLAVFKESITAQRRTTDEPFFLIYVSRATDPVTQESLKGLVEQASRFNLMNGLTGYLFYLDQTFVQYLEGDEEAVRSLFAAITRDPRHADVACVAEGNLAHRLFTGWNMGYRSLGAPFTISSAQVTAPPGTAYDWLKSNPAICCSLFEAIAGAPD
ncbi:EAL domain-containing protein [Roseospira goensis]|uniref:Diguanylate cyclase (GGDEF)-like protein/PAS domain S-box-containing protein n=1 Tax=Roseospira goensis TaxID=391922 RepID=A0A7W6RZZ1_9PROT|nr:diguanylate cyclase (GGDEF)-like protein/PAS domain S-box-containing protein [Roseospira goensis]